MSAETNTVNAISAQLPAGQGTHYQYACFIVQIMEKYRSGLFENKTAELVVYCRIQPLTVSFPLRRNCCRGLGDYFLYLLVITSCANGSGGRSCSIPPVLMELYGSNLQGGKKGPVGARKKKLPLRNT